MFALGALPPDLTRQIQEHLKTCTVCRAGLAPSARLAHVLLLAVPQVEAPVGSRARLLEAARPVAARAEPIHLGSAPQGPRSAALLAASSFRWLAAAAVLPLVLAGWLAVQVTVLQGELDALRNQAAGSEQALQRTFQSSLVAAEILGKGIESGATMAKMQGTEMAPLADGMLYYFPTNQDAVLVVHGLPSLPGDRVYHVWLVSEGKRMSGGRLYLGLDGRGMCVVKSPMPLNGVEAVGITDEPREHGEEPVGQRYLWGQLKRS